MKLHTNVTEETRGLIFKKKVLRMAYRLELSPEEEVKYKAHPEIAKFPMAAGIFVGNYASECYVGDVVEGRTGDLASAFDNISNQAAFEQALREGCAKLKAYYDRIGEIQSGPSTIEF